MAKTNNPEGINQYTKGGGSFQPYRYSVGGYFATKKKQKELDSAALIASERLKKASSSINMYSAQANESSKRLSELNKLSSENRKSIDYINSAENSFKKDAKTDVYASAAAIGLSVVSGGLLAPIAAAGTIANFAGKQIARTQSETKISESKTVAEKLQKDINKRIEAESNNRLIANQNKASALKEKEAQELIVKQAKEYQSVSNPKAYSSNIAKQVRSDAKQITENIRKRMWGG